MGKENFKNLLSQISEKKEKNVPVQKVVPISSVETKKENDDIIKISLSIYVEDWMEMIRFRNWKILDEKNLEFTISDAIQYGLLLLENKYNIKRNREKFNLKRGRRNKEKIDVKTSSIDLPEEKVSFINDFLYYKVFEENNLEYTRPEMFSEMIQLIKENNPHVFKEN